MDFQVLITGPAHDELREIVEFVAKDDSRAAQELALRLIEAAESLSSMPERHPLHNRALQIRKYSLAPYLIYYSVDKAEKLVVILHFWHGAQESPAFS